MVWYGVAAGLGSFALIFLALRFHVHKWRLEGVLALGDAVEVCPKCGMRRVWFARKGQEVRVEQMTKEEWDTGAEVQTKLVRARAAFDADKSRKQSSQEAGG